MAVYPLRPRPQIQILDCAVGPKQWVRFSCPMFDFWPPNWDEAFVVLGFGPKALRQTCGKLAGILSARIGGSFAVILGGVLMGGPYCGCQLSAV